MLKTHTTEDSGSGIWDGASPSLLFRNLLSAIAHTPTQPRLNSPDQTLHSGLQQEKLNGWGQGILGLETRHKGKVDGLRRDSY